MKHENILFGLITLVLLLLIITSVSAQDYLPHKLETNFNLIVNSNNASACNISSTQYPDGTANLIVYVMGKSGQEFNYSLDKGNFSSLGDICFGITCYDGISNEVGSICRTITPNGVSQTTAQGIGSIAFLILMLFLTILFGWMGFKFSESKTLWVLGVLFLFFTLLFIVYDVWLGYEYHRNYTGSSNSGMPEIMFWIFMFILVAGLLVGGALLFTRWEKVFKWFRRELRESKERTELERMEKDFDEMLG